MAFKSLRDKKTHQSIQKLVRVIIFLCFVIVVLVWAVVLRNSHTQTFPYIRLFPSLSLFQSIALVWALIQYHECEFFDVLVDKYPAGCVWVCAHLILRTFHLILRKNRLSYTPMSLNIQVGHMAPDTDSYCTAMAAAELFRWGHWEEVIDWRKCFDQMLTHTLKEVKWPYPKRPTAKSSISWSDLASLRLLTSRTSWRSSLFFLDLRYLLTLLFLSLISFLFTLFLLSHRAFNRDPSRCVGIVDHNQQIQSPMTAYNIPRENIIGDLSLTLSLSHYTHYSIFAASGHWVNISYFTRFFGALSCSFFSLFVFVFHLIFHLPSSYHGPPCYPKQHHNIRIHHSCGCAAVGQYFHSVVWAVPGGGERKERIFPLRFLLLILSFVLFFS